MELYLVQHGRSKSKEDDPERSLTDQGQEVYNLLQQRDIEDVVVMGIHTNACILSQPYGIRRLVYQGKRPLLCRDLTDSFHRYSPGNYIGHFEVNARVSPP